MQVFMVMEFMEMTFATAFGRDRFRPLSGEEGTT